MGSLPKTYMDRGLQRKEKKRDIQLINMSGNITVKIICLDIP